MSPRNLLLVDIPDYGLGDIGNAIEYGFRKRQDDEVVGTPDPDIAAVGRNMVARNKQRLLALQGTPGNRAERRARARQIRRR